VQRHFYTVVQFPYSWMTRRSTGFSERELTQRPCRTEPAPAGRRRRRALDDSTERGWRGYWPTACASSRRGFPIGRRSPHSGHRRCTTQSVRSTTTWSASPHTRQSGNSRRSGPLRSGFGRMVTTSFMVNTSLMVRAEMHKSRRAMGWHPHRGARMRARALARDRNGNIEEIVARPRDAEAVGRLGLGPGRAVTLQ
jgi:hypothetical protein